MIAINVRLDTFKHSDYINILEAFAPAHDYFFLFFPPHMHLQH